MADDYKTLYEGTPGVTPATLYTVPADHQAIVKYMALVNPTGSDVTFTMYRNGLTAAEVWLPSVTVLASGHWEWHGTSARDEAETIGGVCSDAAGKVIIDGDEVDKA